MFTLLIIVLMIICVIMASRKDKHNIREDEEALSRIPPFYVQAEEMGTFSKILNLAVDKSQLLAYFCYNNGGITVTTEDGNSIGGPLCGLFVDFQKLNGLISYTISGYGKSICFYQTTNISDKQWDAINAVLCLAGETRGKEIFSKSAKVAGGISTAIKAINFLNKL